MVCNCMKQLGYKYLPSACPFHPECRRAELAPTKTAKSLGDEALFQKFVNEFPLLTALDLFCWKCAKPMVLTYGRTSRQFYAEFFCHGVTSRVYLTVDQVAAGEKIVKETVLCNADLVRNSEPYRREGP